jgi:hypothetical protein
MTDPITVLYILGAGRSGSTLLTTLLDGSAATFSTADLMQIYEYIRDDKVCGDGCRISESPFWQQVLGQLPPAVVQDAAETVDRNFSIERHSALFSNLLGLHDQSVVDRYLDEQVKLLHAIAQISGKRIVIDSSKYANRAFLFNRIHQGIDVKYIYNTRDVRGVVNSFGKNVQTPRTPISAIMYYIAINAISQVVYWTLAPCAEFPHCWIFR